MRATALGLLVGLWAMIGPSGVTRADPPAAAEGTVHFRNDAGSRFELLEARFSLDGQDLPTVITHAERGQDFVLVADPLSPGRHVVTTQLLYRIKGRKVFTYMNTYRLTVRAEEVLTALPGHTATFTIIGTEKKGLNTPVEKVLQVSVETNVSPPDPGQGAPPVFPDSEGDEQLKE